MLFDGSNGVGYQIIERIKESPSFKNNLEIQNNNGPHSGEINLNSGSEYILKHKALSPNMTINNGEWGFCCDGDGDRAVTYFQRNGEFQVLTGDNNIALFSLGFLRLRERFAFLEELKLGAVCTLYSDNNMICFLRDITKMPVYIAPTGLKSMLKVKDQKNLDLCILSESNGHFSLQFTPKARSHILKCSQQEGPLVDTFFQNFLASQTKTGDFLGVFMLFHFVRNLCGLSMTDVQNLFLEKIKRTVKFQVKNKENVVLDEVNAVHQSPEDLQGFVDQISEKYRKQNLRFFVRKSGTEDVLRVHFECEEESILDAVESEVREYLLSHPEINK